MGWLAKVRRRRGGVYLWRVDHHLNRARRVNGYVGETVSFHFRKGQHLGLSHYSNDGVRMTRPQAVAAQPWSDLNPKMYRVIRLPWWLCWKWVLRPLETAAILLFWPRYNHAKNLWNPLRIDLKLARAQRAGRDAGWTVGRRAYIAGLHGLRVLGLTVCALLIAIALYGLTK